MSAELADVIERRLGGSVTAFLAPVVPARSRRYLRGGWPARQLRETADLLGPPYQGVFIAGTAEVPVVARHALPQVTRAGPDRVG